MSPSEEFGIIVRALRTANGWSRDELADRLAKLGRPVHRDTIGRIESGGRKGAKRGGVTLEELLAFAAALEVQPHDLAPSLILAARPVNATGPTWLLDRVVRLSDRRAA